MPESRQHLLKYESVVTDLRQLVSVLKSTPHYEIHFCAMFPSAPMF